MPIDADIIKSLHKYEIRILHALERMMKHYRWVPEDDLRAAVKLSPPEMKYRLGNLIHRDLIRSDSVPYKGYTLVFAGYDALALSDLAGKKTISALGSMIGVGKESEIYEALGFGVVILKLHKVGQRSFQTLKTNREYMPGEGHCPWIFASARSAEREYEALKALNGKVSVPVPIDINRHVIVMSQIPGANLLRCVLEDPDTIYADILTEVKKAYSAGFIHGDLSEYNIMTDGQLVWLIDWPQWIPPTHQNADATLRHDLETVITYFAKKYQTTYDLEEAVRFVTTP
ncbi:MULTISPECIES: RIO1 family regulatory kinase/ATPase domain-containing protein [Methanocorpusculum]|jgi:RIO kinase 2|uniref:non-specific serine/threonine protein kinase n=1 Tax=Methanocorpusculum parvum TaxID=2193 RepID=A0AAX0Q9N9_9EURY|nr:MULTISPECIES: RIO1 family regulatory kinase/ATPase [Methanocorpusculum]MDD2248804.1 serine/threonine protein phosphatase [Methanocorpusculum sp.]MDD2803280.1 serine/threonine protein phosphatase [Methanocorpusculum sp.]MDD3047176.1 serine/threonine protein phosphatase [Methanocorpusculum sp.]MDD3912483.1 serine/threonine protein phosphatase [Methanocorpusculum sp.]MDD4423624.1 serine/threonine protein phosphatase [Methanocorpusculum parvum]